MGRIDDIKHHLENTIYELALAEQTIAKQKALLDEAKEIIKQYHSHAGKNMQICGLNTCAYQWLAKMEGGDE